MHRQRDPQTGRSGRLAFAIVLAASAAAVLLGMYFARQPRGVSANPRSDAARPPVTLPDSEPGVHADRAAADSASKPAVPSWRTPAPDRGTRPVSPAPVAPLAAEAAPAQPVAAPATVAAAGTRGETPPPEAAARAARGRAAAGAAGGSIVAGSAVAGSAADSGSRSAAEKPAEPDDPKSDRRPPEFQGLRFDPPEVADGGVVTVYVAATDDLSGVRRVAGSLRSPSGSASLTFNATDAGGGTEFAAKIPVPKKAEAGNWWIENVYILDNANNPFTASFTAATAPANGILRVVSSASDATPPEVHRVWVDRAAVNGGDRNGINVEVDDQDSGVETVIGAFQSPTKAAVVEFYCLRGKDPATWSGSVVIPKSADCGEWTLQRLRVRDKAGNAASFAGDAAPLGHVAFIVSGDACDSAPPELQSLTLSTATVTNDAPVEIVVSAVVHDDGSGVASIMGVVSGPTATNQQVPSISFGCSPVPNDTSGAWTGKFTVPQFAAKGTWRVILVRLQDKAQNRRDYSAADPVLARATFEVR